MPWISLECNLHHRQSSEFEALHLFDTPLSYIKILSNRTIDCKNDIRTRSRIKISICISLKFDESMPSCEDMIWGDYCAAKLVSTLKMSTKVLPKVIKK